MDFKYSIVILPVLRKRQPLMIATFTYLIAWDLKALKPETLKNFEEDFETPLRFESRKYEALSARKAKWTSNTINTWGYFKNIIDISTRFIRASLRFLEKFLESWE